MSPNCNQNEGIDHLSRLTGLHLLCMHIRNSIRVLLAIIVFVVVPLECMGMENVYVLNKLSTDALVKRGREKVLAGDMEAGLVCFTVAAKRYSPNLDEDEKYQVMSANIGKWYVYFFGYYDHVNAYKALSQAQEISREIGKNDSRIHLNYGCMYQTLSEQSDDPGLLEKALGHYKESIRIGLEKDTDLSSVNMSFSNLVQVCALLNRVDQLGLYWDKVRRRNAELRISSPSLSFNGVFYGVIMKMHSGNFEGAIKDLDGEKMKKIVSHEGMGRYEVVRLMNLAKAYIRFTGRYSKALEYLRQAEITADSVAMKDARLEVYKYMRDVYRDSGQMEKSMEYQYRYLALKDSVLNYRSGAAISELTYLKKVEDVERNLDLIEKKKKIQGTILWVAIAVIVVALLLLCFLRRHNRNLRFLNETLYKNNLLLIEKEEGTRHKLEESLRQKTSSEGQKQKTAVKYRNSDLNDDEKEDIWLSVMNVMLNSREVFAPDFSSARMADLTGYTYRYISQVINERTGDNFSALVNNTRIKEACRNMQPGGKSSNLTVEAIANSVGFRSKTSFIAAFKKFTGMTPSGYLKIAQSKDRI